MNPNDEAVQLKQIELRRKLAEEQANPDTLDRHNLPATWERSDKFGKVDLFAVTDENREEIEDALGIVDKDEPLLCERQQLTQRLEYEPVHAALDEEFPDRPVKKIGRDPAITAVEKHIDALGRTGSAAASDVSLKPPPKKSSSNSNRIGQKRNRVVELGKGGVRFVRTDSGTVAEGIRKTPAMLRKSYDVLSRELTKVSSVVKSGKGSITGQVLKKQFNRSSQLGKVADREDWDGWAEDFSPTNPVHGKPKGAALTFLERKTGLKRNTIKGYLTRAKNQPSR